MDDDRPRIRNRSNDTPYFDMIDPKTGDKRIPFSIEYVIQKQDKDTTLRIRSGKKYYVVGHEPFMIESYRLPEDKDIDVPDIEIIEYREYKIVDSSRKQIGTITRFTPLERAYSLINRHDFPDHMDESEFIAFVHFTGKKPIVGTIDQRQPYITIPPAVVVYNDILVDDAVSVRIERKDGAFYECKHHHVSAMKNNLIVGLSPFKWLYVDRDGNVKEEVIGEKTSDFFNDHWINSDHFLKDGVPVKVTLTPLPESQCYDLSSEALRIARAKEVKEEYY